MRMEFYIPAGVLSTKLNPCIALVCEFANFLASHVFSQWKYLLQMELEILPALLEKFTNSLPLCF